MNSITGDHHHGNNEEIVIEPFSLNDIKCNTTEREYQNPLPQETDGTQIKYFSAAMGVMGSKRKRESSISSSLSAHKQAHSNWRHALLKARSQSDPWETFHLENYPTEKALRHRYICHTKYNTHLNAYIVVILQVQCFEKRLVCR